MYIGNDQSKAEVDALIEGLAAELNVKDVWINSDLMRIAGLEAENARLRKALEHTAYYALDNVAEEVRQVAKAALGEAEL